jgi:hypothetical protein
MKIGINLVGVSYNNDNKGRYRNYKDAINEFNTWIVNPLKEEGHEVSFYICTYYNDKLKEIEQDYKPQNFVIAPPSYNNLGGGDKVGSYKAISSIYLNSLNFLQNQDLDLIISTRFDIKFFKNPFKEYKFDFIGEIARELDIYRDLIPRDIKKHHPELTEKINKLINRLEANCYSNTKKGKINTAVGIVNLKSNHGWTDRQQIEQHQTNIDLSNLSTEEIKALLKDE